MMAGFPPSMYGQFPLQPIPVAYPGLGVYPGAVPMAGMPLSPVPQMPGYPIYAQGMPAPVAITMPHVNAVPK
jgi:hypothetical protein